MSTIRSNNCNWVQINAKNGGEYMKVSFVNPGETGPKEFADLAVKQAFFNCPISEMPIWVDILRNEKPLQCYLYDGAAVSSSGVYTFDEEIGETEGAP